MIKNLKVAFFVLIIIILAVLVFLWLNVAPPASIITTDEQRLEALQKVSNIPPANPKMTDEQRLKLMNQ